MRKIDIFNHILPPKYLERLDALNIFLPLKNVIMLRDIDARAHEVAAHEDLEEVLTIVMPEVIDSVSVKDGCYLAALANDEMARIVQMHPQAFTAGIATVCLRDMDSTLTELRRAVEELGLRGVQIATTISGENLDEEKFIPFFEAIAEYDLPVLVHPCDGPNSKPDFIFNWPLETSWMMIRLAASGIFERFPDLKIVTHHLGALIPTFHNRIFTTYLREGFYKKHKGCPNAEDAYQNLRRFYNDTALYGNSTAAIRAGLDFFGTAHVLFGTDAPLDGDRGSEGRGQTENTISSIQRLDILDSEKQMIFQDNALKLLKMHT